MLSLRAQQVARSLSRRSFTTSALRPTSWSPGPSPPRLPKEDQEVFEKLQKQSTGAFSTPRAEVIEDPNKASSSADGSQDMTPQERMLAQIKARGDGEELHPNVRRGSAPEFEGDSNPQTGEVGGPKNEPIRWGSTDTSGDWSYNGRVTDF